LEGGLKATYRIRQEDGAAWLSLKASGEGEAGKIADALMARAKGWEFRVPQSQVEEILKRRKELLEKVSS
jgi:inorganic triphosphatase YgiF